MTPTSWPCSQYVNDYSGNKLDPNLVFEFIAVFNPFTTLTTTLNVNEIFLFVFRKLDGLFVLFRCSLLLQDVNSIVVSY